jgi:DNA invertase Pin-like site-specific DNA recombinase
LIIAKFDRLSRSLAFIVTLMDSDVDFIAVDKPHINRRTIHDLARAARDARKIISERIKAALAAVKASGKKSGTRNPNRCVKRVAKARKAKAEQFAASVLAMIRAIEALGWTSNAAIAAHLNARNGRPRAARNGRTFKSAEHAVGTRAVPGANLISLWACARSIRSCPSSTLMFCHSRYRSDI